MPIPTLNDGTNRPPRLAPFLNMGTLGELPDSSTAPRGEPRAVLEAIRDAGFEGVQGGDPKLAHDLGLGYAAGGRINEPADADGVARSARDQGAICTTVHVAWGLEDDDEMDRLADAILDASAKHGVPIYIETHRATMTQDIYRTVRLLERKPDLRLNGDFSHWYTGLEMPYGGVENKWAFMAPAFERVRFIHGRIGNPSHMQVDVGSTFDEAMQRAYVQHFVAMWRQSFAGFLRNAGPGDYIVFAPEILAPSIHYARLFRHVDGHVREESDRWQQALLYVELAKHAFTQAQTGAPV